MTDNNDRFSLAWEIPLAFLSFLFYKVMKLAIGNLFKIYLSLDRQKNRQWRILSAETLKNPITLPVLMTKGPRWNTHAIIGTVGPFVVKQTLAIDKKLANSSANSWIIVAYSFPDYQTIASISSDTSVSESDQQWTEIALPSGKYTLGLRYYNSSPEVNLPAVKVDGIQIINSQPCPANVNEFYPDLIKRKNWFYLSLHYYIFTLLRLRKWFPESFVRGEYLPVGAPETDFFYGELKQGTSLQLELNPTILYNNEVYLTLYNRSSLPVSWFQLEQETLTTEPIKNNGFYLIRVRQKSLELKNNTNELPIKCELSSKNNLTIVSLQNKP
jgi:Family of unknown function (DUF6208)